MQRCLEGSTHQCYCSQAQPPPILYSQYSGMLSMDLCVACNVRWSTQEV